MYTISPRETELSTRMSKLSAAMGVDHTTWREAEAQGVELRKRERKERQHKPLWVDICYGIGAALMVSVLFTVLVGRIYVIPSSSMEPTLHGCQGCENDRVLVTKLYGRDINAGDVIVFAGDGKWNDGWESARSDYRGVAWLQDKLSHVGLMKPKDHMLIKRVVATEGQTVRCGPDDAGVVVDGEVLRDDVVLDPPERTEYLVEGMSSLACGGPYFGPVKVPESHVFVMGDNRTNSLDSRFYGTVGVDQIVGKADMVVYPFSRLKNIKEDVL